MFEILTKNLLIRIKDKTIDQDFGECILPTFLSRFVEKYLELMQIIGLQSDKHLKFSPFVNIFAAGLGIMEREPLR